MQNDQESVLFRGVKHLLQCVESFLEPLALRFGIAFAHTNGVVRVIIGNVDFLIGYDRKLVQHNHDILFVLRVSQMNQERNRTGEMIEYRLFIYARMHSYLLYHL
ncbi:hypothetical protein SDC9_176251 [bioreactor metagenome]|uniref:Uncharacterized protein n=1 Tax=bioreactor metagenome TaxID=1076179 RepID=A0A645GRG2_9ZZZZ